MGKRVRRSESITVRIHVAVDLSGSSDEAEVSMPTSTWKGQEKVLLQVLHAVLLQEALEGQES